MSEWVYTGHMLRVIDGDTIDFELSRVFDFGFSLIITQSFEARLRLLGVNTQELHRGDQASKLKGEAAKSDTATWFSSASLAFFKVETTKTDAFGRYLATVWRDADPVSLNDYLLQKGYPVYDARQERS